MINLSFKENSKGKFVLKVVQNNVVFYQREYDANRKIVGDPFYDNQKDAMKDYVNYLQKLVDKKFEANPNFRWKTLEEFKRFAGSRTTNSFLAEKEKEKEAEAE